MVTISSIQKIERKFNTGDEPVLVDCDDDRQYLCKYSRIPSSSANKLICEFIGAKMLEKWNLDAPEFKFVKVKKEHIPDNFPHLWFENICFGTSIIRNSIDISLKNLNIIPKSKSNEFRLLKIGLFDIWIGNDDRSNNNSNLIYDFLESKIIPIDNGGIFNTVNLNTPLCLLEPCDSILRSELFFYQRNNLTFENANSLLDYFESCLLKCRLLVNTILNDIPEEWNANKVLFEHKLNELFSFNWKSKVWNQFLSILK